jgi:ATP/maltotriose-dependent transcriptional regulator MalT
MQAKPLKLAALYAALYKIKINSAEFIMLTDREIDCLVFYLSGYSTRETAFYLSVSFRTVETHLYKMKKKFKGINGNSMIHKLQIINREEIVYIAQKICHLLLTRRQLRVSRLGQKKPK